MASSIPTIKFEGDHNVKMEDVNSPSAASEQYADDVEDDPELNTENAHKILWMSKLPKYLWEALENVNDDGEIEIGTIRVEGAFDSPERVSLMLNNAQNFQSLEKEYVLKKQTGPTRKIKRPGQVLMFSEKNKPGYKPRASFWDDIDEDGNPGQGRSQLYEQGIKDEKRKESKGRYTPYQRKPIPKITALSGTVFQEFEASAVDNAEHRRLDGERTRDALKVKEKATIEIKDDMDAKLHYGSMVTASERQNIVRVSVARLPCRVMLTRSSPDRTKELQPKKIAQHKRIRPWSFPKSSISSVNTNTGVFEIYAWRSDNPSNRSKTVWKISQSCTELAISMVNGSLSLTSRLMTTLC